MDSLQWVDSNAAAVERKLQEVTRLAEIHKRCVRQGRKKYRSLKLQGFREASKVNARIKIVEDCDFFS